MWAHGSPHQRELTTFAHKFKQQPLDIQPLQKTRYIAAIASWPNGDCQDTSSHSHAQAFTRRMLTTCKKVPLDSCQRSAVVHARLLRCWKLARS